MSAAESWAARVHRERQIGSASEERMFSELCETRDANRALERSRNRYRFIVFFAATFVLLGLLLWAALVAVTGEVDRRGAVMSAHRAEIAAVEAVVGR